MHCDGVPAVWMPVRRHLHLTGRSIGDLWRLERIGKAVGYRENVTIKKKQGFPRRHSPELPTPLSARASDARQFEPSSDFAVPLGRPQRVMHPARLARRRTPRHCATSRNRDCVAAKNRPSKRPLASFRNRACQFSAPPPSRSRMRPVPLRSPPCPRDRAGRCSLPTAGSCPARIPRPSPHAANRAAGDPRSDRATAPPPTPPPREPAALPSFAACKSSVRPCC